MDIFSFKGRANRLEFWLICFGLTVVLMLFSMFAGMILSAVLSGLSAETRGWAQLAFGLVVTLLFLWPILAVGVRRAHDRGASGKWFVLFYVSSVVLNLWSAGMDMRGVPMESAESTVVALLGLLFFVFWLFFLVTLGFLPGRREPNAYGPPANAKIENYRAPAG